MIYWWDGFLGILAGAACTARCASSPCPGPRGRRDAARRAHSEAEALHHEAQRHVAVAVRREAAAHVVERVVDLQRINQSINQSIS